MKNETKYQYQKRIKELEAEVERLGEYRATMRNIYFGICGVVREGKTISQGWILEKFWDLLK